MSALARSSRCHPLREIEGCHTTPERRHGELQNQHVGHEQHAGHPNPWKLTVPSMVTKTMPVKTTSWETAFNYSVGGREGS
jgi:hypothetical protein